MTITTHTNDRKALVKAIADELGTTATYLRAPTYAYQIGEYLVDRDGNIQGEDFRPLQVFLLRNGYISEESAAIDAVEATSTEDEAVDSEPVTSMDITIPARNATLIQLKNLTFMLYARQTIINRMTQSDCLYIPDILIHRLQEYTPESQEEFTSMLDDSRAIAELTGFDFRDGKVSMTFPFDEAEPTKWTAYANLLNRIFDAAMKATRVFPDRVEPNAQNEKYLAHTWLQRLGYSGADSKAERKILLGHLTGYCAFANGDKMQAHKEKYTTLRKERRLAGQEETVQEAVTEEVNGHE